MKNKLTHHLLAALLSVASTYETLAQLVQDGTTYDLTNSVGSPIGTFIVGNTGGNTTLNIIGPGGAVTDYLGYIGYTSSSTNNTVTIQNGGAWTNYSDFWVGFGAAGNQLIVSNGTVFAGRCTLGTSNNTVLITGPDSLFICPEIRVGTLSSSNQLVISDGAGVGLSGSTRSSYLGLFSGSNNTVLVTGPGSRWTSSGNLSVGSGGSYNQLVVSNGGVVSNRTGYLASSSSSSNNTVLVTDPGSLWINNFDLIVGGSSGGSYNQLVVSNGGIVSNRTGYLSFSSSSSNNTVLVTDPGSLWINNFDLIVGSSGSYNQLVVSNGGIVSNRTGYLSFSSSSSNNTVLVTDPGSLWINNFDLSVGIGGQLVVSNGAVVSNIRGFLGPSASSRITGEGSLWTNRGPLVLGNRGNSLIIADSGTVVSTGGVLGDSSGSASNSVVISDGGLWRVLSSSAPYSLVVGQGGAYNELRLLQGGSAISQQDAIVGLSGVGHQLLVDGGTLTVATNLEVRSGTLQLEAGAIATANLLATYGPRAQIAFSGGTLSVGNSTVTNGLPLVVGDGVSTATYELLGNGLHTFNDGLTITSSAQLIGNGTIAGPLTVAPGGSVVVGASPGWLLLSNSPTLQGNLIMEMSKTDVTLTNDLLEVAGPLTYGGALTVIRLGPDPLVAGDSFRLFAAKSYSGGFASVVLPALDPSLMWTNRLLLDGTLAVIPLTPPAIRGVTLSGTNLVFNVTGGSPGGTYTLLTSTDVRQPVGSWIATSTANFDWLGNVTIMTIIDPATTKCFFALSAP